MATPKTKTTNTGEGKKIPGIHIRSIGEHGFRRLGFAFTAEGESFNVDHFTEKQLEALRKEPMLVISGCEIDAPETAAPDSETK